MYKTSLLKYQGNHAEYMYSMYFYGFHCHMKSHTQQGVDMIAIYGLKNLVLMGHMLYEYTHGSVNHDVTAGLMNHQDSI